jgi:hypothetical protein
MAVMIGMMVPVMHWTGVGSTCSRECQAAEHQRQYKGQSLQVHDPLL